MDSLEIKLFSESLWKGKGKCSMLTVSFDLSVKSFTNTGVSVPLIQGEIPLN